MNNTMTTPLKLTRPLCSIDCESTGLSITRDRIVSLALIRISPPIVLDDHEITSRHKFLFNPGFPMSPAVIAVHGITDEDLKDAPFFDDKAAEIHALLEGCDLVGFNLSNFDVPILHEHFARAGIDWQVKPSDIIDAGTIFKIREPRTLEAAVVKYCGRPHMGAHDAMNDAIESLNVLNGQREAYPDLGETDAAGLAAASQQEVRLDLAGKLIVGKDGRPTYNFGEKTKGVAVEDDTGFAHWMLGKDFATNTLSVLQGILDEIHAKGYAPEGEELFR